jgi:pimeloyl-ACP methyl ester carboxylesterase
MDHFVLVHGSHGGGWIWQKVAALLRGAGCEVYTPTLTGLSDRSHLLERGVDLKMHITDVVNLMVYEDLFNVILVGNSYAGMVITGAAAKVPERLKLLIYLDAYVPEEGQSEADLWPAKMKAEIEADPAAGMGLRQPPEPARFGITDPKMAKWVKKRWTPQSLATYTQPLPGSSARSAAIPRVYIHCTAGTSSTTPVFAPFATRARAKGWEVREMATGHLPMLTAPNEMAALLLELSR